MTLQILANRGFRLWLPKISERSNTHRINNVPGDRPRARQPMRSGL
jgi:hypothetical protein